MRSMKILGLSLVATLMVLGGTVATTASAKVTPTPTKPYWDQCSKTDSEKEGWYKDSQCLERGTNLQTQGEWEKVEYTEESFQCVLTQTEKTGAWNDSSCKTLYSLKHEGEWEKVKQHHKFSGFSGAGTLEGTGGKTVTCTADTSVGTITGPKTVGKVKVTFTGCKSSIFSCNTSGAASGEIVTKELEGEIGLIKAGSQAVGLDLWPSSRNAAEKAKHEFKALFVEFECAGGFASAQVRGSVIGEFGTVSQGTKTAQLSYRKISKGKQAIKNLQAVEGSEKDVLETSFDGGKTFEESAEETTERITMEDALDLIVS
jgi:hypothetical protein